MNDTDALLVVNPHRPLTDGEREVLRRWQTEGYEPTTWSGTRPVMNSDYEDE